MDVSEYRKKVAKSKRISAIKQKIRDELNRKQDALDYRQLEFKEKYEPVVIPQNEVKKTIDKKQNELVKKLGDIQKELIDSVTILGDTFSNQGSITGVGPWVSGLPSIFDPYEEDVEGIEDVDDVKDTKNTESVEDAKGVEDVKLFPPYVKEVISRYGFDPNLHQIPNEKEVISKIHSAAGKLRSKDRSVKANARSEMESLSMYLTEIKAVNTERIVNKNMTDLLDTTSSENKLTGKGIRRYKQPKRHAYKVAHDGMYGGLFINYPRLLNEYVVEAQKGGSVVYKNNCDKSLVDLLTEQFNPKKGIHLRLFKFSMI